MKRSKFNTLPIFGGGYYSIERRQALGLSPRLPKGGLRRKGGIPLTDDWSVML